MSAETALRLSVLDLSPVPSGGTAAAALRNTIDLARHAEALGYARFWLAEHHAFFDDEFPDDHPFRRVHAIPEGVATPPIWILGSTDYGAHLAAAVGLGFAFAHHINPQPAVDALRLYRDRFRPSARGAE